MQYVHGKTVLVTGGNGFLGQAVCEALAGCDPAAIVTPRSQHYDLRERAAIRDLLRATTPDTIIHLAAVVGGIGANRSNPGSYFFDNAMMGIQLMEEARLQSVAKYVQVGTVCMYPKFTPVPFREDDLWAGYPEETNAPYGLAKKMLLVQAQAYRQQYGMNAVTLLPVNLYGPRDNFDLESSHVIPALIRKMLEARDAKQPCVDAWGTGSASREFLYVHDAARAIVLATQRYDKPAPVNLGSGQEVTIRDLAVMIAELCGFDGVLRWNTDQPDGQPRRCLDTTRAKQEFGFQAATGLVEGLRTTIQWYEQQRRSPATKRAA
jgi:GDP-L-fucose synthase